MARHLNLATPTNRSREAGSSLIAVFLVMSLLAVLVMANAVILQKGLRQSNFFSTRAELALYAQSAANLAIHDLNTRASGNNGKLGTVGWTSTNDVGKDGVAGTSDEGEGDGLPTDGEPNVDPIEFGPSGERIEVIAWVEDTAWSKIQRIVATAYRDGVEASMEVLVQAPTPLTLPGGATYLSPSITLLQYNGNGADGNDANMDGSPGPMPATYGIATAPGVPGGTNAALLLAQIDSGEYGSITGLGGTPSVGEDSSAVDVDALFDTLKAIATISYSGGNMTNAPCGTAASPQITYFSGTKWSLSTGAASGYGILLVETDDFSLSGSSSFYGLVIVRARGAVALTGGSDPHVVGQLIVSPRLGLPTFKQAGSAEVQYSSQALNMALSLASRRMASEYTVLHRSSY